jgi:hypothetical protein
MKHVRRLRAFLATIPALIAATVGVIRWLTHADSVDACHRRDVSMCSTNRPEPSHELHGEEIALPAPPPAGEMPPGRGWIDDAPHPNFLRAPIGLWRGGGLSRV